MNASEAMGANPLIVKRSKQLIDDLRSDAESKFSEGSGYTSASAMTSNTANSGLTNHLN